MPHELFKRFVSSVILIPLSLFFIFKGTTVFILFLTILFLISSSEWINMNKRLLYKVFGINFLILSFMATYLLRNEDLELFLLIIAICVSTDLGGYIFGKIIKGPKLIKISPNKTYSGMIGGYLLSIIILNIFYVVPYFFLKPIQVWSNFLLFILSVSTISQIGDIIFSYFKRMAKIKDTGKIIPGHGGLLDRIDGMIFSFPFSFCILKANIFQFI
ncbi:phosphatidate cytidylyltransferase [Candidatus Pelagibacter sp.]|nr:phosphatidate cytidylyltransferase [Candidatus Pelagibacter sp.]